MTWIAALKHMPGWWGLKTAVLPYATNWLGELDDVWLSASQAAQARCCGNPLVVVSRNFAVTGYNP